jgi:hypothetical protein
MKTFDEACSELASLLRREEQPSELHWVCREDVTGWRRRLVVHPSPPASNRDWYRDYFDFGQRQARGIRLEALCFAADRAYCYVWVPEDDLAASQAMVSSQCIKYSFATEGMGSERGCQAEIACCPIAFHLRRAWCRWRGESPRLQDVPSRKTPGG